MFKKELFILAHQVGDRGFYPPYKRLLCSRWKPYSEQKDEQEKQLRHIIRFAYNNFPYYQEVFKSLDLRGFL